MPTNVPNPSAHWRTVTNNFLHLSRDIGGSFFRHYARRQCLIGIDGMLEMSDEDLAVYDTNRLALTKLRARLATGQLPAPAEPVASKAA